MIKAIALLSGGLDSILAAKVVLEQGIELEAVNFLTVFCNCTGRKKTCLASKSAADQLGIKLKVFEVSREYFDILKKPKYGYGRNLNPCLDCRIFMFRKAASYMKETGASFVVTGEVLGERPMSQRMDALRIVERDSGLDGLILRPLSAKLLKPTIPEKNGLIDRERLLDIKGRSRKPQIQLAKELGIRDYPCPAGGCLLTDPGFANRMRDLMKHKPDFAITDVQFLKVGRYFRMEADARLIVGRNEDENRRLLDLAADGDHCFRPIGIKGPVGIGRGLFGRESLLSASRIVARYSDSEDFSVRPLRIAYKKFPGDKDGFIEAFPFKEEELAKLRI